MARLPGTNGSNGRAGEHLNGHAQPTVPTVTTEVNGNRDHGADGRFTPGNRASCGNPFNRRCARLRSLLFDCVSDEDIKKIARQLVKAARQGDVAAAKVLFGYLIGKPTAAPDPDLLDRQEWLLSQEGPPGTFLTLDTLGNITFAEALVKWANYKANSQPTIAPVMPDTEPENEVNPRH